MCLIQKFMESKTNVDDSFSEPSFAGSLTEKVQDEPIEKETFANYYNDDKTEKISPAAELAVRKVEGKSTGKYDLNRLYMDVLAKCHPLTIEEEIKTAKDIENGRGIIARALLSSPLMLGEVINLGEKLRKGILSFDDSLNRGTFSKREVQAIDLVTAQENGCQYCLAAHTTIAKKLGFSEEETFQIRTATIDDPTLNALTGLAKEILTTKGYPYDYHIEKFFSAR